MPGSASPSRRRSPPCARSSGCSASTSGWRWNHDWRGALLRRARTARRRPGHRRPLRVLRRGAAAAGRPVGPLPACRERRDRTGDRGRRGARRHPVGRPHPELRLRQPAQPVDLAAAHLRHPAAGVHEPAWMARSRGRRSAARRHGTLDLRPARRARRAVHGARPAAVGHTGPRVAFDRAAALDVLVPFLDDALVFGTTGYIGRELYARADRPLTFYMQGSMGHALGLGLGAALAQPTRRVVVVDGDGAILMHLGAMVTAGQAEPAGLVHVVLDNAAYESTGSQPTSSRTVDWVRLAGAAGYRSGSLCASPKSFRAVLRAVRSMPGPHLVVARIGTSPGHLPPRVTTGLTPGALRARFQAAAAQPIGSCR